MKERSQLTIFSRSRATTELVVLPPARISEAHIFGRVEVDNRKHEDLLAEMQKFRGRVYLGDGAIRTKDLTSDGRHKLSIDEHSWHVLSLDGNGRVCACLRYLDEGQASGFDGLWVRHAALSECPDLGRRFRSSVEEEMRQAREMNMGFGEVGGWAVGEDYRGTIEPLRIILATYGLLQIFGGCIGVATATSRHSSSTILRKIGLAPLSSDGADLPAYYDPAYGCQMEVLRFDSRYPNQKYRKSVFELTLALMSAPVICRHAMAPAFQPTLQRFEPAMELRVPLQAELAPVSAFA